MNTNLDFKDGNRFDATTEYLYVKKIEELEEAIKNYFESTVLFGPDSGTAGLRRVAIKYCIIKPNLYEINSQKETINK